LTTAQWHPLDAGDAGIWQTVGHMTRLTDEAVHDPAVVMSARQIVRDVNRSESSVADAVLQWVHEHVRYVRDPVSYELLIPPKRLLDEVRTKGSAAEDCDSMAMLTAALLQSVGLETRFAVVAQDTPKSSTDHAFEHVYVEAKIDNEWLSVDPSVSPPILGRVYDVQSRATLGQGRRSMYTYRGGGRNGVTGLSRFGQSEEEAVVTQSGAGDVATSSNGDMGTRSGEVIDMPPPTPVSSWFGPLVVGAAGGVVGMMLVGTPLVNRPRGRYRYRRNFAPVFGPAAYFLVAGGAAAALILRGWYVSAFGEWTKPMEWTPLNFALLLGAGIMGATILNMFVTSVRELRRS